MCTPSTPLIGTHPRENTVMGIVAIVLATLFFAVQDTISKHAVQTVPVAQIMVIRFFFFSLFALTYACRSVRLSSVLQSKSRGQQIGRGVLIVSEAAVIAYAFKFLGVAELHAIFACCPLIVTALSVPFLGESVGWRRWVAVLTGFIGTLIILQPGSGVFSLYSLLVILGATMYAVYMLMTRKVSRQDSFQTSLVYFGVFGFLTSLIAAPFYWQALNFNEWVSVLAISCTAIAGHMLVIKALQLVPAVVLQPFNYCVLVWAMILGYLVYGEVLTTTTIFGVVIVVGSGIFVARREYSLTKQKTLNTDTR